MKTVSRLLLLLVAMAPVWCQIPYTRIVQTLQPGSNGLPVNGSLVLTWTEFNYEGEVVAPSPQTGQNYLVSRGLVNVPALAPTDHASATVTYRATLSIGNQRVVTYWSVPTLPSVQCASASFCTVAEVTVAMPDGAAPLGIQPRQIAVGSSTNGQLLCNLADITGWCDPSEAAGALLSENNLSDLDDAAEARGNLGLGDAATKNTGTSAGTVAAGDDARFSTAYVPTSRTISANTGLSGGGDLSTDRSLSISSDYLRVATVGISSAQIKDVFNGGSFITLVPAQGENTYIEVVSMIMLFRYGAVQYANGAGGAPDYYFLMGDGSANASISVAAMTDFINGLKGTTDVLFYFVGKDPSDLFAFASTVVNQPFVWINTASNRDLVNGDGTITAKIVYRVHSFQ